MSILKGKERTYQFSCEGLAQCKADSNLSNTLDKYNAISFMIMSGITVTGLYLVCNPLSNIITFKTNNDLMAETAFKMIINAL